MTGLLLAVRGELDMQTAPWLETLLRRSEQPLCTLTIDLSGVTFTDCAGIDPVLASRRRRAPTEQPLRVSSTSPAVTRLLSRLDIQLGG